MRDYEYEVNLDYAELYRQNYEDALDEIRNLRYRITELEKQVSKQENGIESTNLPNSFYPSISNY